MKRIVAKKTLVAFWTRYADSEQYLKTWYQTVKKENWKSPQEVKKTYATASILKEGRVVFNIKGNAYRLVSRINYEKSWVFIRFIGTHNEYNQIDANTI